MLLQQRLLSKHGVFNDKLEQTGNVVCVEMVSFTEMDEPVQQRAFTIDIPNRTM